MGGEGKVLGMHKRYQDYKEHKRGKDGRKFTEIFRSKQSERVRRLRIH